MNVSCRQIQGSLYSVGQSPFSMGLKTTSPAAPPMKLQRCCIYQPFHLRCQTEKGQSRRREMGQEFTVNRGKSMRSWSLQHGGTYVLLSQFCSNRQCSHTLSARKGWNRAVLFTPQKKVGKMHYLSLSLVRNNTFFLAYNTGRSLISSTVAVWFRIREMRQDSIILIYLVCNSMRMACPAFVLLDQTTFEVPSSLMICNAFAFTCLCWEQPAQVKNLRRPRTRMRSYFLSRVSIYIALAP